MPLTVSKAASFTGLLLLLSISLLACACSHTEAAPPKVPITEIMQAVHAYSQGQHGHLPPLPSSLPDEVEATYNYQAQSLLAQGDYAQLEKMAQINRTEPSILFGGYWKTNAFYGGLQSPPGLQSLTDKDYQNQIEAVKKWLAARPDSAAARIELANLYVSYADHARGSGYADTVTKQQWELYHSRTALARQLLLEAAKLNDHDAHWYMVMQFVALNDGWDRDQARELFDAAVDFQPDYYHFYINYAHCLLPQWYGDRGDIQALAEEAASKNPEPFGSMLYFQTMGALACYCGDYVQQMKYADWPKLKQGFANLDRYYGTTSLTASRYAAMAAVFQDKPAAHDAFQYITKREDAVWTAQVDYDHVRAWSGIDSQ